MENQEEKQNIDSVDGKITTFVSPAVLATILDRESLNEDANIHDTMIDTNEQEPDQENLQDSLEFSLNDSLELRNLQEFGVAESAESTVQKGDPLEFTEQVLVFPKTSTPSQKTNKSNGRTVEKASRERRPQHIIERNKENVGKRMPSKTSYAQMHATKAKNKLDNKRDEKSRTKQVGEKSPNVTSGSDSGLVNQPELLEEVNNDLDQSANSYGDASQTQNDLGYPVQDTQEGDLPPDSVLNGTLHAYHNQHHGPYYDVSQSSNVYHNAYESGYSYQPVSYTRGYQSAVANLRQSHAMAGPISSLQYNPLSTQSAPPGGYGYYRKPLDIHHLHEEDYYNNLSSALPNTDFVNSDKGNQIPEPSLHRKFSSEPHLVQSSSPSLQKMENVGRDSKASGSYSSLRQPFQYKPYTLKDYRNIAGSNVEHLAGGLGPNVDTDQFKEKMKNVGKQREYAAMLRSQHSTMRKKEEKKGSTQLPVRPKHIKEAEIKRQAALNYAKNVPKPKQMSSRKRGSQGSGRYRDSQADDNQEEITVLEILRLRHEKEKKEVDTIRKDLASKIRL